MTSTNDDQPPLTRDVKVIASPPDTRDPFVVLDDLMLVIEALCPEWPPRHTVIGPGSFQL
jgi:hypothetical protein